MTVSFFTTAQAVTTLLLLICIGYYSSKIGILDAAMSKKLSSLTVNVAQPFMLFNALSNVEYSGDNLKTGLLTLALALLSHLILAVFAFFTAKYQKDPAERKVTEFGIIFVNAGFIGLPILGKLFGDIGTFWGAFYCFAFNLCVWSYGIVLIARGRKDIKMNIRKILINHGTVPCMLGFLFFALQIPVPGPVASAVQYMNNICTPLVLLVIGANLTRLPLKQIFTNYRLYIFSVLRLLACPVLIALIYHLAGMSDQRVMFFAVEASLPAAAVAVMFAEIYNERPELAAQTVGMSTLLSMATIPVAVALTNLVLMI
ncbi:MAG: AEC family transporter [Clostridia bacterium]|nr:AEC family transporter [Clostridia bacterium]